MRQHYTTTAGVMDRLGLRARGRAHYGDTALRSQRELYGISGNGEHFTFVKGSPEGFVCVAAPLGVRRQACKIEMLPGNVTIGHSQTSQYWIVVGGNDANDNYIPEIADGSCAGCLGVDGRTKAKR